MELCKQWGVEHETFLELKNWFKNQNHLPQNTPDEYFAMIVHSCYSDIQKSKKTIDAYFRLKTSSPQLFAGRSLHSEAIQQAKDVAQVGILPQPTGDGYTVLWWWMADPNPTKFFLDDIVKFMLMVMDVVILENPGCPGIIMVQDGAGFSLKHMFRLSFTTSKKYLEYIQDASPLRFKGTHTYNVGAVLPRVFAIIRPFIYKEYNNLVNLYSSREFDLMLKNTKITKDMVPEEYGGQGPSAQKLFADTLQKVASYEDWFKFDETLRAKK